MEDLTGTAILLKPGIISGGPVSHECPLSRSIGYFLEPIIMLAPFAKKPLQLTLRGITTDEYDLSVRVLSYFYYKNTDMLIFARQT
jgi:RNA 3'-terminal phosphate cyclase-like protein